MEITFRPICKDDHPFLKKVYRSTREKELLQTFWTEEEKQKFIDFQFKAQHSHYVNAYKGAEFNIIMKKNTNIGRLYIWETENQIRIMDIALLEEFTGKGIGTYLLKQLIQKSRKKGKKLNIHVEYNNPALRLYERLGFKKTDNTGVYFFMEYFAEKKEK